MWGQRCTRPDFSFVAGYLAWFQLNPRQQHWHAVKWMGYIKQTIHYCITFHCQNPSDLTPGMSLKPNIYADSNHASCKITRRLTLGYVIFMAGAPVCWSSKQQAMVALSTMESKYISLTHTGQQATWPMTFLSEVDLSQGGPVDILGDNFSMVSLTGNSRKHHNLVKHIDVQWHYIQEMVEEGKIKVKQIWSNENITDMLTKSLGRVDHSRCIWGLCLDCMN